MELSRIRPRAGLAEELRISVTRLSRRLRVQASGGLSIAQQAALAAIERHDGMTPRALAEHEKVRPPSMTRVIAALEEQGLVSRSPHPTDGRQVVLHVTEQGRALLKELRRRREAWLSQRLRELTAEERAVLRRAAPILDRLSKSP